MTQQTPFAWSPEPSHHLRMDWTTPSYEELKMDAEIGSYQEDGEWPPIVEPQQDAAAE
jgi:hypothetical protein